MRHIPGVSLHWPGEDKADILSSPGQKIVDRWRYTHVHERGWLDIGYHYIVHRNAEGNAEVYDGRPDSLPGAHSGTNWGNQFLGINVAYGMDESVPEDIFDELAQLIADLSKEYGFDINRSTVKGHRNFLATECPGASLVHRFDELIALARQKKSGKQPVATEPPPEPKPEEQLHPARLKIELPDGTVQTVDAVLINSQLFVHVPKLGPTSWDGSTKTGTLNLKELKQ